MIYIKVCIVKTLGLLLLLLLHLFLLHYCMLLAAVVDGTSTVCRTAAC